MCFNDVAMQALKDGCFEGAQRALENSLKQNPCHQSFNNLGVFYFDEGIRLNSGKVKDGRRRGLKMLQKACHLGQSYENYAAIGKAEFALGNYKKARRSFAQALGIKDSYISLFNLGMSWMRLNEYKKAADCFLDILVFPQTDIFWHDVIIPYAFCLSHFEKDRAAEILNDLVENQTNGDLLDVFVLAFCCEKWSIASELCDELIETWSVDLGVMAMVVDCNIKLGKLSKAQQYLHEQILLQKETVYNPNKTAFKMQLLLFSPYRKHILKRQKTVFPILADRCYLTSD